MIVCICRGVCDRTIEASIADGAATIEAVITTCHAGDDCGQCRPFIARMLAAGRNAPTEAESEER